MLFSFNCRSALQEVLVHLLKHTEPHEALKVLFTLAFKQSPPKNFMSKTSSTNSNTDSGEEKGHFQISLMSDNFMFAHGDDGGVMIKGQNDNVNECDDADGVLRNLRGDGLSDSEVRALCIVELLSDIKKDSVAGDFFIYLLQELTNLKSAFSEDMDFEGTVLLFFHQKHVVIGKFLPLMTFYFYPYLQACSRAF